MGDWTRALLPSLTLVDGSPGSGDTLSNLAAFQTLVIAWELAYSTGTPDTTSYGKMQYSSFSDVSPAGIDAKIVYCQGAYYVNRTTPNIGATGITHLPVGTASAIELDFSVNGTNSANGTLTLTVYGTDTVLPFYHRTLSVGDPLNRIPLYDTELWDFNNLDTSLGEWNIPLPITSRPARLYVHNNANSAGTQTVRLLTTIGSVQYERWDLAANATLGNSDPFFQFQDLLYPTFIRFNSSTAPGNQLTALVLEAGG